MKKQQGEKKRYLNVHSFFTTTRNIIKCLSFLLNNC